MNQLKTRPTSFRLSPVLLDALRAAAQRERRSQANMLEVMVREYCQQHGVDVKSEPAGPEGSA
jgi:hypothetical protein